MLWRSPSGLVLIDRQPVTGVASVNFTTGINGAFDQFELAVCNMVPSVAITEVLVRFSTDGGASYLAGALDYDWGNIQILTSGAAPTPQGSGVGATGIRITDNASYSHTGLLRFNSLSQAVPHTVSTHLTGGVTAVAQVITILGGGTLDLNATAVNAFQIIALGGTLTGTFALSGRRAS